MRDVLREIEWAIRGLPVEIAYVLDAAGVVVLRREGIHTMVDLSDIPLGVLAGRILTHNHPQGTSFSWQDVRLLLTTGLAEVRAVGASFLYILRAPTAETWENVADLVEIVRRQVEQELVPAVNTGALTPAHASLLYWHQVWAGVAEIRGWDYRREELNQ